MIPKERGEVDQIIFLKINDMLRKPNILIT